MCAQKACGSYYETVNHLLDRIQARRDGSQGICRDLINVREESI